MVWSEWTKLRTEPGQIWSVVATAVVIAAVGLLWAMNAAVPECPPEEPGCVVEIVDAVRLSLSGVHLGQLAVVVFAVLVATDEYATGLIHTTLTATPRRLTVFGAKAAVVTGAALVSAALGVLTSFCLARIVLPGNGFAPANGYPPVSLTDGPTARAMAGTILYLGLIALLGLGVGLAVRDTVAALTIVLSLLYALPVLGMLIGDERLQRLIAKYAPMTAGLSVQATERLDQVVMGGWPGLGVVAVWAGAAALLGAARFVARDA